jgi:S-adenosylmethionine:tRNA ribosyltransferase-isomerase
MTAEGRIDRQFAKLLVADADGTISHLPRATLASLFRPGDLVVANDAATLPASLQGVHRPTGEPIEARLAGWVSLRDLARFVAVAFGAGDWVEGLLDHPRLIAADPIAFESPSAGFALEWRTLKAWRKRGVGFATLSHAAGLSSTGDAALDRRLPFDEFYRIPGACASAIEAAKSRSGRVIAIGTSVVRALESAANAGGAVRAGEGRASGRIARGAPLRVADAILTGVHQPGESRFELLRAFSGDRALDRVRAAIEERGYRGHEFGDSLLIERQAAWPRRVETQ